MTGKIVIPVLLLLAVLTAFFPVCAQETQTVEALTFTDDLDREVVVPVPLTSVVTLAPSLTETIAALGAEDLIVATDINSDYPAAVADVEKVTGWDMAVNYEVLLSLEPDLVFVSEMTALDEISSMEDLGLTVYCVKNPADFPELFESILVIGEVIGKTPEAEALAASLEDRVAEIEARLQDVEETPTVFYEIDATDPSKPWTAGKGTFISKLIQMAGGVNIGDALDGEWIQISLEALLTADPEIILLGDSMYGSTAEAASQRTGWSEISAVKNGRLFEFDDNLVTRPGPRLVEGYELIAEMLHPEAFK
ncbi:MAG: ABC transporter substrate-binding protein [Anaerolineaceae bacterium]|nr:ABC transporter substrate-binding protein [Anaerolineaceae bacterium]